MQNLEALTRDSYYNLRDATSHLRQRYHSRAELRQAKPKADYQEFWDEDSDMDEEEIREGLRGVALRRRRPFGGFGEKYSIGAPPRRSFLGYLANWRNKEYTGIMPKYIYFLRLPHKIFAFANFTCEICTGRHMRRRAPKSCEVWSTDLRH